MEFTEAENRVIEAMARARAAIFHKDPEGIANEIGVAGG